MSSDGLDSVDKFLAKIPGIRSLLGLVPEELNTSPRTIYFNQELPASELDDEAQPVHKYASNKVRTTKYTPMTFLPKNLALQFRSVANIFFLFVAIVSSFSIFGVATPGIGVIPIAFILVITAVRDAIEDHRRFLLDREVNNALTYVLLGIDNPNHSLDAVTRWRMFKKACSRAVTRVHRFIIRKPVPNWDLKSVTSQDLHIEDPRFSMDTTNPRQSFQAGRLSLEATRSRQQLNSKRNSLAQDRGRPSTATGRPSFQSIRSIFSRNKKQEPVRFKQQFWKNIEVGSVIKLLQDEPVPADIVVLSTSEEDGSCFIETRNLDGETMLKPRLACPSTKHLVHASQFPHAQFRVEVEGANSDLDQFGYALHTPTSKDSLGVVNFIPRGASIRNTKMVIGYVVYTGIESKIAMNSAETPRKRSRIAKDLNMYIYVNFGVLAVLATISTIIQRIEFGNPKNSLYFFEFGFVVDPISLNSFVNFIASIVMFQNIIPLSLYISIEIVKTVQAWFIYSDLDMYDPRTDEPCTPKTWNIGDDLGQIEFVFTDKTGTLTQNSMVFRKCTINGKSYGTCLTEAQMGLIIRKGGNVEEAKQKFKVDLAREQEDMEAELKNYYHNPFAPPQPELVSADIYRDIRHDETVQQFVTCLALCSTVVAEKQDDGHVVHKSESPDEGALVGTANSLGYMLINSPKGWKYMKIMGETHKFKVIQTIFFTSDRKRMSTVIRDESGRTFVYAKGADAVIKGLLAKDGDKHLKTDTDNLAEFGNEGLRTLLLCWREIDSAWADEWSQRYTDAQVQSNREELTEKLNAEVEHSFHLLGGTGIEDQLQEDVPETINKLSKAGIKVWCLTGDKPETAISIGFSCTLLELGMEILRVEKPTDVSEMLGRFNLSGTPKEMAAAAANHGPAPAGFGLVVDGEVLKDIVVDKKLVADFALLGKQCRSVLCCRVSPSQKALVVTIIKEHFDVTALSIGDGANDVPMIQKADVGIGIVGVEGRQAAMSADYAIGQFKFLQKLVLVHGHWSYVRTCNLVGVLLYKNAVFMMPLFWNGIFNQFDNSYVCDYSLIVLYNSVFTSCPIIVSSLFEQDVSAELMLSNPYLYAHGILRQGWTPKRFISWTLEALYQSVIIYFFSWLNFHSGQFVNMDGIPSEYLTAMGVYIVTTSVLVSNTEVLLVTRYWDWITLLITLLSAVVLFTFICVYTSLTSSGQFYGGYNQTYGTVVFWASTLLTVELCLAPKLMWMSFMRVFFPSEIDIAREQDKQRKKELAALDKGDREKLASSNTQTNNTPNAETQSYVSSAHALAES